jgi:hypothetical protein
MTDRSSALRAKTSYAAKYGVEFFERKTVASYALWSITLKDPETGRYPRLPTAYGRTDTLEQAHLELTDWCESRGLSFSDIRSEPPAWRLVKALLEGKSGTTPSDELNRLNFEPVDFTDQKGESRRMSKKAIASSVEPTGIVEVKRGKPMVSSLKVAALFGRRHDKVLEAIRTKLVDGLHLPVSVEMSTDERGRERPVYWLTEEAALTLMPFLGGRKSIEGQQKLVRAYLWYRDNFAGPQRGDLLAAKRAANTPMLDALIEQRAEAGKATAAHHFATEAKLCNFVVTGQFKPLDERSLTNEQAELLAIVRRRNESLLMAGLDYEERKRRLAAYATKTRTARLSAQGAIEDGSIKPPQDGLVPIGAIAKRATEGGNPSGEGFIPAPGNTERAA